MFERTRIPHVQKDLVSDASRLLDLGGLAVDRVASDAFGGRVVHLVTADETASACPSCGVLSVCLKGRVCTRPRDIPYGTRVLRLIWHKRRWRCKERLCPRASFTESLPAVRARSRLTTRLRVELGCAVAEQGRVVSESAAHYGAATAYNEGLSRPFDHVFPIMGNSGLSNPTPLGLSDLEESSQVRQLLLGVGSGFVGCVYASAEEAFGESTSAQELVYANCWPHGVVVVIAGEPVDPRAILDEETMRIRQAARSAIRLRAILRAHDADSVRYESSLVDE